MSQVLILFAHAFLPELGLSHSNTIGRVSLARENEAGGTWGQEVHIHHVKV